MSRESYQWEMAYIDAKTEQREYSLLIWKKYLTA
jgi:hypothetical protein